MRNPVKVFHSIGYIEHNARRLEHLASLRIPVANASVLEVGAGIGDHTSYYNYRNCSVTATDARKDNVAILRRRYPKMQVFQLDMEHPTLEGSQSFDFVHCYGLLYHLNDPVVALQFLAEKTKDILFLETCVSFGNEESINLVTEDIDSPSQSVSGLGCRPTRPWIFNRLSSLFEYVYIPRTQPNHHEFPLDWTDPDRHSPNLQRAVFIASKHRLDNPILTTELLDTQVRH